MRLLVVVATAQNLAVAIKPSDRGPVRHVDRDPEVALERQPDVRDTALETSDVSAPPTVAPAFGLWESELSQTGVNYTELTSFPLD